MKKFNFDVTATEYIPSKRMCLARRHPERQPDNILAGKSRRIVFCLDRDFFCVKERACKSSHASQTDGNPIRIVRKHLNVLKHCGISFSGFSMTLSFSNKKQLCAILSYSGCRESLVYISLAQIVYIVKYMSRFCL